MSARALTLALIASAALNIFLLSAGLALVARGVPLAGQTPPQRPAMRRAALELQPSDRVRFIRLLKSQGMSVRGANRQARALRLGVWDELAQSGFDRSQAKADLARARALNQASRASIEDALVDFAAALPQDERASFAHALRATIPPLASPPRPAS